MSEHTLSQLISRLMAWETSSDHHEGKEEIRTSGDCQERSKGAGLRKTHVDVKNLLIEQLFSSGGGDSSSITFLPLQSMKDIAKKPRFNKFFNVVYFSNR